MASCTYRVVLVRSTSLARQHVLMYIHNHRLCIRNRRFGIRNYSLSIRDHRLGIHGHRLSIRNRRVGVDYQLGLKGGS
jgi:hypothetical protein